MDQMERVLRAVSQSEVDLWRRPYSLQRAIEKSITAISTTTTKDIHTKGNKNRIEAWRAWTSFCQWNKPASLAGHPGIRSTLQPRHLGTDRVGWLETALEQTSADPGPSLTSWKFQAQFDFWVSAYLPSELV